MKRIFWAFILLLTGFKANAGCLLFDYEDFGPQALAYETVGYQWYQWNSYGDSDPQVVDRIKILVYWNETLATVKASYPVNPDTKADFRYITLVVASKYLEGAIKELSSIGLSAERLQRTKKNLQGADPALEGCKVSGD